MWQPGVCEQTIGRWQWFTFNTVPPAEFASRGRRNWFEVRLNYWGNFRQQEGSGKREWGLTFIICTTCNISRLLTRHRWNVYETVFQNKEIKTKTLNEVPRIAFEDFSVETKNTHQQNRVTGKRPEKRCVMNSGLWRIMLNELEAFALNVFTGI